MKSRLNGGARRRAKRINMKYPPDESAFHPADIFTAFYTVHKEGESDILQERLCLPQQVLLFGLDR